MEVWIIMGAIYGTNPIITDNLSLYLDASHQHSNSTTWKDVIGSNNATNNGSTFVAATSTSPSYYSLDGSNDYLNISSPNSIVNFGTNPYTVELWFNIYYDDTSTSILDTRNSSSGVSSNWYVQVGAKSINSGNGQEYSSSRKLRFGTGSSSTGDNFWDYDYKFASNQWNGWLQVLFIREGTGSNQQKMYWNGVHVATDTDASDYNVSSNNLVIGKSDRTGGWEYTGYLSILRIYNGKGLSAAEALQNFNANRGRFNL